MHKASLSPAFLAELSARRGGRGRLYESLDPRSTALLVVDMQNVFVDAASPLCVPSAVGIVANVNRLADGFRQHAATVIWLRSTFSERGRSSWPLYFETMAPAASGVGLRELFFAGSQGHAFWPGLHRREGDLIVDKDRFSGFSPGASTLETILAERRIASLVIAGTLTNVCCESTMRDAMMRDFRCVLVSDANAAQSDQEHVAALENAARYFGDVAVTDDVLERLVPASRTNRSP